jgi:molybdopterin synthase sulfur carrier subunit
MAGNSAELSVEAGTVGGLIRQLDQDYPGFAGKLLDEGGNIRRFINIYVNQEDVRFADGLTTLLKDGDEVSIIPAIAGGAPRPRFG